MNNLALIGNGYWGSIIKKYISEFFELKYVADSKFDKNIIWKDDEIAGVIVATPIETHYKIIKEALENGKHVFSEKPVTLKHSEACELEKIAKKNELRIGVDYVHTFSKLVGQISNYIEEIGGIKYIEMSTKHLGRFMDQDVYWLLASHHLSVLDMFMDIDKIDFKFEDHLYYNDLCTTGSIIFNGGRLDVSTNFPGKEMLINFYGEYGTIKYRPLENQMVVTLYNKKYKLLPKDLTEEEIIIDSDEQNNLKYAIEYFKDLIDFKADSNLSSAIKITKILESR